MRHNLAGAAAPDIGVYRPRQGQRLVAGLLHTPLRRAGAGPAGHGLMRLSRTPPHGLRQPATAPPMTPATLSLRPHPICRHGRGLPVPPGRPHRAARLLARLPGLGLAALLAALTALTATAQPATGAATAPAPDAAALGEQLYRLGRRADGSPLSARRATVQGVLTGPAAACETCHRRSAMGMQE
ncbi:MAG: hypothetical protein RLZZ584_1557, partial [Pseudomonadota bacterium]